MVELILKYRVKGKPIKSTKSNDLVPAQSAPPTSESIPAKRRISHSIQALMSRLNVSLKSDSGATNANPVLSPVEVDIYCDHGTQTALHIAVKNKHFGIASLILGAGSNPNLTIYLNEEELSKLRARSSLDDQYVFTGSSVLVESVRHRDMGTVFKFLALWQCYLN